MSHQLWFEEMSRRSFLEHGGRIGAAAALAPIPLLLDSRSARAIAATPLPADVVRDTLKGLLAFVLPGDDAYSVAQGESARGPGSIGGGSLEPLIRMLDNFVPAGFFGATDATLPGSQIVAGLLNQLALRVDPSARHGPFLSPFARLSFREKGEVFRRFEADRGVNELEPELKFVAGILPASAAFTSFSEAGVFDRRTRRLTRRPVGSAISGYGGPAEGHADFRGYFQGRRAAVG
jgi:hypothetical protein